MKNKSSELSVEKTESPKLSVEKTESPKLSVKKTGSPELDVIKEGVLMDLEVLREYLKNLNEDNPFTLDGLATMKAVKQICIEVITGINIVAGYNVAKKNKAVTEIIIKMEHEASEIGENQYYL